MTGLFRAKQDLSLRTMISRMLGAAKFNGNTFKELRGNPSTTLQTLTLAPTIGLCYGVGLGVFIFLEAGLPLIEGVLLIILSLVSACIIAFLWSAITYALVTKLFRRTISYPNLARPFLFSWTPGLLFIMLSIPNPFVSEFFRVVATAWVAIASIFAVRHAAELTIQQSMMTFIISVLILVFALTLVDSLLPLFFA